MIKKKRSSWKEYTTSLSSTTTTTRSVWNKIQSIEGKSAVNTYPLENVRADDNRGKSNVFLDTFFADETDSM